VPTDLIGDPVRLRQVLLNLIDNAIKFTEQGHVALVVDSLDDRDGKVRIRFRVEDTGIGIPEAAQRDIFDAFEQADASTTRTHGGTGLGLNIARQLVEAMGGELHLDSDPGRGTIFSFAACFGEQPKFSPREILADDTVLLVGFGERQTGALERQLRSWQAIGEAYTAAQLDELDPAAGSALDRASLVLVHASSDRDSLSLLRRLHALAADRVPVLMLVPPGESLVDIEEAVDADWAMLQSPPSPRRLFAAIQTSHGAEHSGPSAAPPAVTAGRFAGHVLVAEDNPVNAEITTEMLHVAGCTVERASDGAEAVKLFAARDFDLVLMDCAMPGTDGFEATAKIRLLERELGSKLTPIVALTASAIDEVRQRCHDVGMDGFLGKPHTLQELSDVLGSWLQNRSGSFAPDPTAAPPADTKELAALDPRALKQIHALQRAGEPSLLARVIGSFLESTATTRAALEKAAGSGDADALRTAAHGIKAASGNVGAHRMVAICRQLEALGKNGTTAGADELLLQLDEELATVTALLEGEARKVVNG